MNASELKERLRADLKVAMQARATDEVRLLRALIAALDNAEAVSAEGRQDNALPRAFGDPSGEVDRRRLSGAEIDSLLAEEVGARRAAAADYEGRGRGEEAARLRSEAALVERYRTP